MNILITGAGSVMGQSIYKALAMHDFHEPLEIHFSNSLTLAAGFHFKNERAPVVATPIVPQARTDEYLTFINDYVEKNKIDIIFTGTQHELKKLCAYRDKTYKAATLSSSIADICVDKIKTADLLNKYGIRSPQTQTLRDYVKEEKILGAVVIKPNHSSSSRSIYRFNDRAAALAGIAPENLDQDQFLVQNMLVGEEYTCGCYIDRYSKQISQITFKRTLTVDGATYYGEIINDKDIQHYVSQVANALIQEGLDFGHINVQLIIDKDGPCLFEINGRLSSTEASKAHFGFNSCAAFVANIVHEKSYDEWNIATQGRFIRYYEELYF